MIEPDLFDWTPPIIAPSQRHSQTSVEAAALIQRHIGPLHERLLDYLAKHPKGCTDDEMQTALDMNPSTQRPRRIELACMGKIRDTETTRKTRSGRSATVWALV